MFRMATPMGFEPTISTVTGWHVNRYTTGPSVRPAHTGHLPILFVAQEAVNIRSISNRPPI
jgi:hypothetical protein